MTIPTAQVNRKGLGTDGSVGSPSVVDFMMGTNVVTHDPCKTNTPPAIAFPV